MFGRDANAPHSHRQRPAPSTCAHPPRISKTRDNYCGDWTPQGYARTEPDFGACLSWNVTNAIKQPRGGHACQPARLRAQCEDALYRTPAQKEDQVQRLRGIPGADHELLRGWWVS